MIKVVDSHHKVLPYWAELRSSLQKAPRLITLDHHTDTSKPFRRYIQKNFENSGLLNEVLFDQIQSGFLKSIDFRKPDTILEAIKILNNDEHIVAAIKSDVISSAFVIAHNAANTDLEVYKNHKIMCRTIDEYSTHDGKIKCNYDTVLETKVLNRVLKDFDELLILNSEPVLFEKPYILDIDLDYFNTFKSILPNDRLRFKELAIGASLITIATEPEYVKSCAVDKDLTSEYLLDQILILIS